MNAPVNIHSQQAPGDQSLLIALLGLAILLRLVLYPGFFGSDDTTYTFHAVSWLLGNHTIPEYVGANRLGITWPVAAFIGLLGGSNFSANLWSLLCSVGEVAIVWAIGMRLGGRRMAFIAALILLLTPLHISFSGRMAADSPVSFFMTLAVAGVLLGHNSKYWGTIVSGLAAGFVFWIKPPLVIFSIMLFALMLAERRPFRHYLVWCIAAAIPVLMNFAAMWIYAGDPLYILKVMSKRLGVIVTVGDEDKRPHAYLQWLLIDIRFTWLIGWLALAGLYFGLKNAAYKLQAGKLLIWSAGLLIIFSLWPASISPIKLIFKQSNYMTIFLAPLALAASLCLVRLSNRQQSIAIAIYAVGGLILATLLQADVQSFTANARSTPQFVREHTEATFYLGKAGRMAVQFDQSLSAKSLNDLNDERVRILADAALAKSGFTAYAIIDPISGAHRNDPTDILAWENAHCWTKVGELTPTPLSWPAKMARDIVITLLDSMPISSLKSRSSTFMAMPAAIIYQFNSECDLGKQ